MASNSYRSKFLTKGFSSRDASQGWKYALSCHFSHRVFSQRKTMNSFNFSTLIVIRLIRTLQKITINGQLYSRNYVESWLAVNTLHTNIHYLPNIFTCSRAAQSICKTNRHFKLSHRWSLQLNPHAFSSLWLGVIEWSKGSHAASRPAYCFNSKCYCRNPISKGLNES